MKAWGKGGERRRGKEGNNCATLFLHVCLCCQPPAQLRSSRPPYRSLSSAWRPATLLPWLPLPRCLHGSAHPYPAARECLVLPRYSHLPYLSLLCLATLLAPYHGARTLPWLAHCLHGSALPAVTACKCLDLATLLLALATLLALVHLRARTLCCKFTAHHGELSSI
jgi:hypothetical protein